MDKLSTLLACFAFVCFVLATTPLGLPHWNRLVSAGLACFVAIPLFTGALKLFG